MSVRKIMLGLLVAAFFLASCSSLPSLPFGPTATPTATATPKPITVSDPDFLIGLWRGTYSDSEVIMSFDLNGNIGITAYGQLQGGTFTLDLSTIPYQLDIEITDVGTITTIIEFVDANTIKIENVYHFDPRPTTFFDFFLLTR